MVDPVRLNRDDHTDALLGVFKPTAIGVIGGILLYIAIYADIRPAYTHAAMIGVILGTAALQISRSGDESPKLRPSALVLPLLFALAGFSHKHVYGHLWASVDPDLYLFAFMTSYAGLALQSAVIAERSLKPPYSTLFLAGWNLAPVVLIGFVAAGVLWALLVLWASLMGLLGVMVIWNFILSPATAMLITPAAFGMGIGLALRWRRLLDALRQIALGLGRIMLPVFAFIVLTFLLVTPFTGLEKVRATSLGSANLLLAAAVGVVLVNAVIQFGAEPVGRIMRLIVGAVIAEIGVLTLMTLWGIGMRIAGHGMTPRRHFMLVLSLLMLAYAAIYAISAVRGRLQDWSLLFRGNTAMAFVVIAASLLMMTPILSPYLSLAR